MKTDYSSIIARSCTLLMLLGPVTDVRSLDIRKYDSRHECSRSDENEASEPEEKVPSTVSCANQSQAMRFDENSGLSQLRKVHSAQRRGILSSLSSACTRLLSLHLLSSLLLGCQIFHREQVISEFLFSSSPRHDGGAIALK